MNTNYCLKNCLVGKKTSEELLDKSESVFDAAADFWEFTSDCFKTCPYKYEHKKGENK